MSPRSSISLPLAEAGSANACPQRLTVLGFEHDDVEVTQVPRRG